jgi:RimJ/RimL family protein N-acetyltransferase
MPLDARALAAMRELLGRGGWLWANTPCLRAVTNVPSDNPIAYRFGSRAGLKEYGRNPRSFLRGGVLRDQILMGISKE